MYKALEYSISSLYPIDIIKIIYENLTDIKYKGDALVFAVKNLSDFRFDFSEIVVYLGERFKISNEELASKYLF